MKNPLMPDVEKFQFHPGYHPSINILQLNNFLFNGCTNKFNDFSFNIKQLYQFIYKENQLYRCCGKMKKILLTIMVAVMFMLQVGLVKANEDPDDDKEESENTEEYYIEPFYKPYWDEHNLKYENGIVSGNNFKFKLNETTGTITDYILKSEKYDYFYDDEIIYRDNEEKESSEGNDEKHEENEMYVESKRYEYKEIEIKIFEKIEIENFKYLTKPLIFEEKFIFMAENVLIFVEDNYNAKLQIVSMEDTINVTYYLNESLSANQYPIYEELIVKDEYEKNEENGENSEKEDEEKVEDDSKDDDDDTENNDEHVDEKRYPMTYFPYNEISISGNNTQGSLMTDNGTFEINNTRISLNLSGYSTFNGYYYEPIPLNSIFIDKYYSEEKFEDKEIWEGDYNKDGMSYDENGKLVDSGAPLYDRLNEAIKNDKIALETSFSIKDEKVSNEVNYYNENIETKLLLADKNQGIIKIEVSSDDPEGKVVMIDLDEEFLSVSDFNEILVKFDDEVINHTYDINNVLGTSNEALFHLISGEKGVGLLVYVPSFSKHTISVEKQVQNIVVVPGTSEVNKLLPTAMAVGITVLGAVVLVRRGKKEQH